MCGCKVYEALILISVYNLKFFCLMRAGVRAGYYIIQVRAFFNH